jgi:hypothetical protein
MLRMKEIIPTICKKNKGWRDTPGYPAKKAGMGE